MSEAARQEKVLTQWGRLRLAHEAMMLQDAQQALADHRQVSRLHQQQTLNLPPEEKAEESMIHIGDVQHVHEAPPAPPAPPASPAKAASKLLPLALAAAGLLTGGAGTLGLVNLLSAPASGVEYPAKEFDIHWQLKDGKFTIDKVAPVPPK